MIVLLHGAPAFGAVERYVETIAHALRESDEEVVLVYPECDVLEPFAALADGSVSAMPFELSELSKPAPVQAGKLARRLRHLAPRLVHVTDAWATGQIAARLARPRRLLVTHHTPELPRADSVFGRVWFQLGWLTRPEVIYTSEADRSHDSRGVRNHLVPLGIDLNRFAHAQPAFRHDGPVIGNVARLAPQKGQSTLIDAATVIRTRYPNARFVIVGEGELRNELEQRICDAGLSDCFELTGKREDVPELLASFDVFALPSHYEGLCFAVIEAQAAGVPVVATPVGGVAANVVPGETGVRCAPGDAASLATGILSLLEHPDEASRLAAEAKLRVQKFSIEEMVEKTLRLYNQ